MNGVKIIIRGGGDLGTGVAWTLFKANLKKLIILEKANPLSIRREVCFSSAIYEGKKEIEGVKAEKINKDKLTFETEDFIQVSVDEKGESIEKLKPHVIVDAILSKRNFRHYNLDKYFVIGLGPEFQPSKNCHVAIETNRGHNLGKIFDQSPPMAPTGTPAEINGYSEKRLLRAPVNGIVKNIKKIGEKVEKGNIICFVDNVPVKAEINGILRGLIHDGAGVGKMLKIGDIDPRGKKEFCYTISEKSRCVAGSVLLAIMANLPQLIKHI